jgi:hypothetical protein
MKPVRRSDDGLIAFTPCVRSRRRVVLLIQWEFPRLCRGGSRSLTFPGVVPGYPSRKLVTVSRQSTRIRSSTDGRARKPKPQQVGV